MTLTLVAFIRYLLTRFQGGAIKMPTLLGGTEVAALSPYLGLGGVLMKRLGLVLAALALIASITGALAANDRPLGTIRGQVSTIDAASGSLVIKLDGDQ